MYISEIFKHLLGTGISSNESNEVVLKRGFTSQESVHRDPFTPVTGVKHPSDTIFHASGICSPASNSSAGVITFVYSKYTKCHSSGHINSNPFFINHSISCLSTSQELKRIKQLGWKLVNHLKAYLIQRNYTLYILA